jgi:hypothetical protein
LAYHLEIIKRKEKKRKGKEKSYGHCTTTTLESWMDE